MIGNDVHGLLSVFQIFILSGRYGRYEYFEQFACENTQKEA